MKFNSQIFACSRSDLDIKPHLLASNNSRIQTHLVGPEKRKESRRHCFPSEITLRMQAAAASRVDAEGRACVKCDTSAALLWRRAFVPVRTRYSTAVCSCCQSGI